MKRLPHNIENQQFLLDPSHGFLEKCNGADGSSQWVYRTARDKLIA